MSATGSDELLLQFPDELPVSRQRAEIAAAIERHPVVVLCGATGSGKTTQIPKICLQLGRGRDRMIGHTQPRRLAARSVAARLAAETGTRPGTQIGYQIRFSDQTGPQCRVKLMTDGILLQEIVHDRQLRRYDTLIVDEAHERSINIDFLLGYLKTLLPRRPDLRVVVTSATIDPQRLAEHFDGAPIIEVSGRAYPVEVRYRPPPGDGDLLTAILAGIEELRGDPVVGRGDVLVFLPGERDIRDTARAVRQRYGTRLEVLPLYARLAAREQDRIYARGDRQRVVLATNVAETSLTVPGIAAVIDPGLARISRYSPASKIQQLPIEPVSRASAEQRTGRCGRVGPGVCLRLYDEDDFAQRPEFTDPEIVRTSLAGVVLRMADLGLGEIGRFPFPDPPDVKLIRDAHRLLRELGAMQGHDLTPLGRRLARLSVDPRIGRMLLASGAHGCLREMLIVAAGLSIPDPRERDRNGDDDPPVWHDPRSEFNGLLKLWEEFHRQQKERNGSQLRKWCRRNGLAFMRMREWQDLHRQLRQQCHRLKLRGSREPADAASLHTAILTGLLSHIGQRQEDGTYRGARGLAFRLAAGSALRARPPRWIVAASIVRTRHAFAALAAEVRTGWIEQAGAHLLKKTHGEPFWHRRRRAVVARETVRLYGLTLSSRRLVKVAEFAPQQAREVFIRDGLVAGGYAARGAFVAHNRGQARLLEEAAARLRRGDLLPDAVSQQRFFEARLPADCTGPPVFERWRRAAEADDPQVLCMQRADLTAALDTQFDPDEYPDELAVGANRYPLRYRFAPGEPDDGVTVVVPVAAAGALVQGQLDWLVPGYLADKTATVIRGLPKALRRRVVPAPQRAAEFVAAVRSKPAAGSFYDRLARFLTRAAGEPVTATQCAEVSLPAYLCMRIELVDPDDTVAAAGRELTEVKAGLGAALHRALALDADTRWHRDDIREWDFGALPRQIDIDRQGVTVTAWPGLEDADASVRLRLYNDPDTAARYSRAGIARLIALRLPQQAGLIAGRIGREPNIALLARLAGGIDVLTAQTTTEAIATTMLADALPRSAAEFAAVVENGRADLVARGEALADEIVAILATTQELRVQSADLPAEPAADIRTQLDNLVFPGFVALFGAGRLAEYPRYLRALQRRIEALAAGGLAQDRRRSRDVDVYWQRWVALEAARGSAVFHDSAALRFRFLIEEYRVSLFAQQLGTRERVSPRRLDTAWREIEPDRR